MHYHKVDKKKLQERVKIDFSKTVQLEKSMPKMKSKLTSDQYLIYRKTDGKKRITSKRMESLRISIAPEERPMDVIYSPPENP